jgi:phage terminase large subunit-like protein
MGPQPGKQELFLASDADVVFYGGGAGSGKTWGLLWDPIQFTQYPGFGATIFRRTFAEIDAQGGLWEESTELYPHFGAVPNQGRHMWVFPSGATIRFAHLQHEKTKYQYHGAQIGYMGFDELQHFTQSQAFYLFSRNRSTTGIRSSIRAGMNADANWVADFIQWYWDEDTGYAIEERGGVVRWFTVINDESIWGSTRAECVALAEDKDPYSRHEIIPKSFTFIPADIYDNPILLEKDPAYLGNLQTLAPVDRERLLESNWKIRSGGGKFFNKAKAPRLDQPIHGGILVRYWDFAGTEKDWRTNETTKTEPSDTAGILLRRIGEECYIEDYTRGMWGPPEVERRFLETNEQDREYASKTGAVLATRWEREPGSASIRESYRLQLLLDGQDAEGEPVSGDKYLRARPFMVAWEAGRVSVLNRAWAEAFLNHLHNQNPGKTKTDGMDAGAGAYRCSIRLDEYVIA